MENETTHNHCIECNKILLWDDGKHCKNCKTTIYPTAKSAGKLELRNKTLSMLHYLIKLVENDRL